jgi:hypothetical protein
VLIDLAPRYVNEDGHAADAALSRFVTPRVPNDSGAVYESHVRLLWPGLGDPQEYDSVTFTNNFGYIDRDRFVDNPDGCLRIVHLGSSHAVALQVRPFEKHNLLLEEELAVRLGRCVEVLHAGRDNGDIGANYASLRDYAARFSPDFVVIETSLSLIGQLHPELLRAGWGWDHDHSGIGNFYYDASGELSWRPPSPEYPIHATTASYPELVPGVPFFTTFLLPEERQPEAVREAFGYLVAITQQLQREFPDTRIVLQSALDQAQARSLGRYALELPSGESVEVGADEFVATFDALCDTHGFECVNPPVPPGHGDESTLLTFVYDGHYSPRGHQWLAEQIAEGLVALDADTVNGSRDSR